MATRRPLEAYQPPIAWRWLLQSWHRCPKARLSHPAGVLGDCVRLFYHGCRDLYPLWHAPQVPSVGLSCLRSQPKGQGETEGSCHWRQQPLQARSHESPRVAQGPRDSQFVSRVQKLAQDVTVGQEEMVKICLKGARPHLRAHLQMASPTAETIVEFLKLPIVSDEALQWEINPGYEALVAEIALLNAQVATMFTTNDAKGSSRSNSRGRTSRRVMFQPTSRSHSRDDSRNQGWGQFNSGIGIVAQFQFQFQNWNSNSNSRIGIGIGEIENGIGIPGIGIENGNWIFCNCYRSTYYLPVNQAFPNFSFKRGHNLSCDWLLMQHERFSPEKIGFLGVGNHRKVSLVERFHNCPSRSDKYYRKLARHSRFDLHCNVNKLSISRLFFT